jgi:SAM-dependent methyltransferase
MLPPVAEIDEQRRISFDARAELYDAARPTYPDALAADVLARVAPERAARVLEIGAGTGKATLVFARRGAAVVALEPGPHMAAVLRGRAAGFDVTVVESTFEAWPLDGAFDIVMSAQAIHWVDPAVRYVKAAAALAPGGTLAVIRNEKATLERGMRDDLDAAYARLSWPDDDRTDEDAVEHARRTITAEIDASGLFGTVEARLYPWIARYTTAQYLDLLDTYSDHAILSSERRASLYEAIGSALDRRGGEISIPYVSLALTARHA